MSRQAIGTALAILLVCGKASASPATFTWDPSAASPALAGAGSAFTADTIEGTHNLYDIGPIANPSPVIHTVSFVEQITGFTLNGSPVATPGLNGVPGGAGSYGLYLTMQNQAQNIGPPNIYHYLSGQISLMAGPRQ